MLALLAGITDDALAGILRVPEEFATIQAAVDAAVSGDVIRVGPGTYYERVTISKSAIRLEADPVGAAILDGMNFTVEGPAIALVGTSLARVRDVAIVGFRIQNQLGPGISLVFADQCEIRSNTVSNTTAQSVAVMRSRFNLITGNTLSDGTIGVGISTVSSDNTVKENTISGRFLHGVVVSMVNQTPLRNLVKDNVVCLPDPAVSQTGVLIAGFASANIVKENRIVVDGNTAAIRLQADTTGNVVKENVFNAQGSGIADLGTGNKVTENVRDATLRCP